MFLMLQKESMTESSSFLDGKLERCHLASFSILVPFFLDALATRAILETSLADHCFALLSNTEGATSVKSILDVQEIYRNHE